MQKKVIIIGAGGHARVIADSVNLSGDELLGFLDDFVEGSVMGYPVLGKIDDADDYADEASFVIGIGDNKTRYRIASRFDLNWYTAIHPSAIVSKSAVIGEGTVIMAGAVVNACAVVGKHCIINTLSVVEHDNVIGNFAHISPHATLLGAVKVGERTHIGGNSTIRNNTSICSGCVIGAGAVVTKSIKERGVYAGVPATLLEHTR